MCSRLSDGKDGADLPGKEISARRLFLSLIWIAEIAYFPILKNLTVPKDPQLLSATPLSFNIYMRSNAEHPLYMRSRRPHDGQLSSD
jgi:hypothetical protein